MTEGASRSPLPIRALGDTGLQVHPLCVGTAALGDMPETYAYSVDEELALDTVRACFDGPINFLDTANADGRGACEERLGRALHREGRRHRVVLATKVHGRMDDDDPNAAGNSRRHIVEQCEASLRRLQTDYLDLYQLHRPQPDIPIDETLRALDDLVRAGKVRYIGSSTFPASQIVEAQWVAARRGRERFVCEQPPYSMLIRGVEADVLPTCQRHGMGVIPWSPLAGGWLTGKWRLGLDAPSSTRADRIPGRYDLGLEENQRKLAAAAAPAVLAEAIERLARTRVAVDLARAQLSVTGRPASARSLRSSRSR